MIQIVYETLKDQQEGKKGRAAIKTGGAGEITFINHFWFQSTLPAKEETCGLLNLAKHIDKSFPLEDSTPVCTRLKWLI